MEKLLIASLVLILAVVLLAVVVSQSRQFTGAAEHAANTNNKNNKNNKNETYWRDVIHTIQDSRFDFVTVEPGLSESYPKSTKEHIILVESGSGYLKQPGKPNKSLRPRDIIRVPPNTPHSIFASNKTFAPTPTTIKYYSIN